MPQFIKDNTYRTPFGKNQYLRSTQDVKFESYRVLASTIPSATIDGTATKVLQPGVVMAKLTSTANAGMIGPYQPGTVISESYAIASDRTGGTFTITVGAETTGNIAYNANAAAVLAALVALDGIDVGAVTVTGTDVPTDDLVITLVGPFAGQNIPALTFNTGSLTGGTALTATATQGDETSGAGAASDGRQLAENIVGINDTFLPWQLNEYTDSEVAVAYEASLVSAWCLELDAAGTAFQALSQPTKNRLRELPHAAFTFH
jgi:hypothetical protein